MTTRFGAMVQGVPILRFGRVSTERSAVDVALPARTLPVDGSPAPDQ